MHTYGRRGGPGPKGGAASSHIGAHRRFQSARGQASTTASGLGLAVHAGHGLTTENVTRVAAIPELEELSIGHHIVSRSVLVGMEKAVREMRTQIDDARVDRS